MKVCVAVVIGKFRLWSGLNLEKLVVKFRTQARSQHTAGELKVSCKFVIYRSICEITVDGTRIARSSTDCKSANIPSALDKKVTNRRT